MSMIKICIEKTIAALAEITGYDFDYLMDLWIEECEEGDGDFEYFLGVTLEQDW